MVADLAFRAYKLNPHLGARAALETPGVALIDEVDMFCTHHGSKASCPRCARLFLRCNLLSPPTARRCDRMASESVRILRDGKVYAAPAGTEGAEPGRFC